MGHKFFGIWKESAKIKAMSFKPVDPKVDLFKKEEETIKYWKENKTFEKSVENRPKDKTWTFLDGPPFVTGLPHYGHLLTSVAKDIFPRFWTMKGYRVRRVWGWDGHGLPVENKVEVKLGIKSKKEIEDKVGIDKFIEECKKYVSQTSSEWEWYVDHIARWVDFKNAYRTWDMPYMESVMWVFRQLYDKGHVYKGLRVSLYCPHCATPISNFEVAMDADNYKDIVDASTVYKYQVENEKDTFFLAWSTTPWTKITTTALAVNPKLEYVKVSQNDEFYILAKATLKMIKGKYKIVDKFKGTDLIGKRFIPYYDYFSINKGQKAFEIISGDFVSADEGVGIVTISPYGEEDLQVMQEQNVHKEMHLDDEGNVKGNVPNFGGMYYLKANKAVNEDLAKRGLIYSDEELSHRLPLCWRCHTRLYYAPQNAWYVDVQKLKKEMMETNEKVNWIPKHFKHGRFLKSLENAPDWNISRSRYWGSPVPVWECECGERYVPGSIKELEEWSGTKITDLHKPQIDEVEISCRKCGKKARRVPEVLDSWIEAGSASFGERHFPFEETEPLEEFYPPDFIVEYTGQIRAWFYVLHVISNALYKTEAFKNVLVNGVILGTDGRKMSKNYGNYPDPKELIEKYGGDALRLYLASSPVMMGEDVSVSEEQYRNQVRFLLVFWNIYNFFVSNAIAENWTPKENASSSKNILDTWIISRMYGNIKNLLEKGYQKYDPPEIVDQTSIFVVRDLSLWYVRRIRDRIGPSAPDGEDKESAYQTLWFVLREYCKAIAPLVPFITEEIYRNITGEESVHLSDWPAIHESKIKVELEAEMEHAINLASAIHAFRKDKQVVVKVPLKKLSYKGPKEITGEALDVLLSEVNVYLLEYKGEAKNFEVSGSTDDDNRDLDAGLARDIVRKIQAERKKLGTNINDFVNVTLESWPEKFEEEIKRKALVKVMNKGKEFKVESS